MHVCGPVAVWEPSLSQPGATDLLCQPALDPIVQEQDSAPTDLCCRRAIAADIARAISHLLGFGPLISNDVSLLLSLKSGECLQP